MSRQFKIQPQVRSIKDDAGAVLLDLKAGKYYSLNPMGTRIWLKIEEGRTWPEILDYLKESFQAPAEVIERDADSFVGSLEKKRLISETGAIKSQGRDAAL